MGSNRATGRTGGDAMPMPDSAKPPALRAAAPRREALVMAGVLLAVLLVNLRSLAGGFVHDDNRMIVRNAYIGQWSFLWKSIIYDEFWYLDPAHLPQTSYYRPLQDIWLGLHYQAFGLNPVGWHLTLLALYLLAVWLVYRVGLRLTEDWRAASLGALLFGLLPLHAEAVSWIAGICELLCAAFELAAFYLFIDRGSTRFGWPFALVFYAGALLTHESAMTFPAVIGAYAFLLDRHGPHDLGGPLDARPVAGFALQELPRRVRETLVCVAPFAAVLVLYLISRRLVLGFAINGPLPGIKTTWAQAVMTMPALLCAYLGLLAMPWFAAPAHHFSIVTSLASPHFYLPLAGLIVFAAGLFVTLRNDRRGRLYLFALAWMLIAIAPAMNIRPIFQGALLQDRYLFLVSAPWCVMLADLAIRWVDTVTPARAKLVWSAAAAMLVVYAAALWNVQRFWHDDIAYYTRLIEISPDETIWYYGLGQVFEQRGALVDAEREFSQVVSRDPKSVALYDLGVVHARLGRVKEAVGEEAAGLTRWPDAPADAYIALAQLYDQTGDQAASMAALSHAESMPGGAQATALARAQMAFNGGDLAGADSILRDLANRTPEDSRVWTMMGVVAARQRRNEDALTDYQRALTLAPRDTFTRLLRAAVLVRMDRDNEALEQCRAVLAVSPNDPNARALIDKINRKLAAQAASPPPR